MKTLQAAFLILIVQLAFSQAKNQYRISFENAIHHEAKIQVTFPDIKTDTLSVRMSRTSPGRYALHEFAKNVYDVVATDGQGKKINVTRPNPHQWDISNHDGTVHLSYILFADRGDGTYSQIDETHAHLNIPATFMYAPALKDRAIALTVEPRGDLNWKVAAQLNDAGNNVYTAPDLQYFMDSPVEISNHTVKEFKVTSNGAEYIIRLVLHHQGTEEEANTYFENVKKIVLQEEAVFGEYPKFDNGIYTFLACYMPQVSGDGMEHRNSTILTSTRSLANEGMKKNIGTVSHEFFHAWNVERIRPKTLEPFNFEEANMSGELWFAEGFTSYYTNLILCRAGILSQEEYIKGLTKTFNYVWNSPARAYFNPIEMSYQAPFVDAATSVDPVNRANTFISYYSYGSVLGLALDLSLRSYKNDLNLDDYMKLVWGKYGKTEVPYTKEDLQNTLRQYAGETFANNFFGKYIDNSQMPDYKTLFSNFGIALLNNTKIPYHGIPITFDNNQTIVSSYPKKGTPAYAIGLSKDDIILDIDGHSFTNKKELSELLNNYRPGQEATITYKRFEKEIKTEITFAVNPNFEISLQEKPSKDALAKREHWLKAK
ncbi:M61 family metallopeptidase [Aquimarina celericrescens]|uniref:M61 family metallopeptidase n=1 Tax=Aquimarina celericrescens TaxID=1964542 RepID=A0ABW5AXH5_9FLAO|nr:M61 family metallopeptidase [Aquimarina celericrescens]